MNQNFRTTRSFSQWAADAYWDFMDVNSNLERAEIIARSSVPNGTQAGINFFIMLIIVFPLSIIAAWHFDFHSTYDGMTVFITEVMTSVSPLVGKAAPTEPIAATRWIATITAIVTFIVTVAPTAMELFTSNFARGNILVIKVFVLGASIFDVVTDIPTTKQWVDKMIPAFDAMGPILSPVFYYIAFFGWLALATVGFQLSVIVFGYVTYLYLIKWTVGMPVAKYIPQPGNSFKNASNNAAQALKNAQQTKKAPIAEATVISRDAE